MQERAPNLWTKDEGCRLWSRLAPEQRRLLQEVRARPMGATQADIAEALNTTPEEIVARIDALARTGHEFGKVEPIYRGPGPGGPVYKIDPVIADVVGLMTEELRDTGRASMARETAITIDSMPPPPDTASNRADALREQGDPRGGG